MDHAEDLGGLGSIFLHHKKEDDEAELWVASVWRGGDHRSNVSMRFLRRRCTVVCLLARGREKGRLIWGRRFWREEGEKMGEEGLVQSRR
jgi:hypothetical protein